MDYSGAHDDLLDAVARHPLMAGLLQGARGSAPILIGDASEQAWPFLAAVAARHAGGGGRVWFVCRDVRSQEEFASELSTWIRQAVLFPDLEIPAAGLGLPDPETASERIALLGRLARGERIAPVITANQWEESVSASGDLTGDLLLLPRGWRGAPGGLALRLEEAGYERVAQVTRRGEFSLRGGILDLFS